MRRVLVVDASVVRSAGESAHPVSSACRECLLAILEICHRVVTSAAIREEWDRHMSRFSRKWRRSMAAKKKPVNDIAATHVEIDTAKLTDKEHKIVEKDRLLLCAALAPGADGVIVSRDCGFPAALAKTAKGPRILQQIMWIDPVRDGVKALEAL